MHRDSNTMKQNAFYRLGIFIFNWKKTVICFWIVALLFCIPTLPKLITPFQSSGFENFKSESYKALNEVENNIGYQKHRVLILFSKKNMSLNDLEFRNKVDKSLKQLNTISAKHEVIIGPVQEHKQILAVLAFKNIKKVDDVLLDEIESKVKKNKNLKIFFGGEDVFLESINKQTQKDLFHADMVAGPISIITLILVFGSLAAALMPIIVGAFCAILMLGFLYFLAFHTSLSIFTINIALLLGLCLSLDYALFIISRFREELILKQTISEAMGNTLAHAGKAVFFSGLAVFASLSALLLFPINILVSVGVGGLCAVFLAVLGALSLLPAILGLLKTHINFGTLFKFKSSDQSGIWGKIATVVTKFPYIFASIGMIILLFCAIPVKDLKLGIYDYHILPPHSEGRVFFQEFTKGYDEQELSPITIVVETNKDILNSINLNRTYKLIQKIKNLDNVHSVSGYLSWIPHGRLNDYKTLYLASRDVLPDAVKQMLKTSTNKHMSVFYVLSDYSSESKQTQKLVKQIRNISISGLDIHVSGVPANNVDVINGIKEMAPKAVSLILVMTFIVLLALLKSLFLPIKAIVMNILSILATYGSLVYIFQLGHGEKFLHFDSQGSSDISMLIIIFCALFGFSMDYEVFLLSRIQECFNRTKDNKSSIIFGIDHSAKIITSAAWIVIVLCGSFLVADVLMVKAFGLGIAIAIFLDAFIIRIFLVPAIMTLTKRINWYCPKILLSFFK